jgi:hypothetical protein
MALTALQSVFTKPAACMCVLWAGAGREVETAVVAAAGTQPVQGPLALLHLPVPADTFVLFVLLVVVAHAPAAQAAVIHSSQGRHMVVCKAVVVHPSHAALCVQ